MRRLILPLAALAMIALLFAALATDCVLLAGAARQRATSADEEMQKHEARLAKLLGESPRRSAEMDRAIEAHRAAATIPERHAAYERLVASVQLLGSAGIDPTNPLDRKFTDDVAGAINRREISQRQFDQEWTEYQAFLESTRGKLARRFSAQAKADWQAAQ